MIPAVERGADDPVHLAVVIVTWHSERDLDECLGSLRSCDRDGVSLDIIIVDNAPSDDRTKEIVVSHRRLRYVREERPGLDVARKVAITGGGASTIARDRLGGDGEFAAGRKHAASAQKRPEPDLGTLEIEENGWIFPCFRRQSPDTIDAGLVLGLRAVGRI